MAIIGELAREAKTLHKKGNIEIANAVFDIPARKINFEFHGISSYKISPHILSLPGRFFGFDVYLTGVMDRKRNPNIDIVACYKRMSPGVYCRRKMFLLVKGSYAECDFIVLYFELFYLRKRCKFKIIDVPEEENRWA